MKHDVDEALGYAKVSKVEHVAARFPASEVSIPTLYEPHRFAVSVVYRCIYSKTCILSGRRKHPLDDGVPDRYEATS